MSLPCPRELGIYYPAGISPPSSYVAPFGRPPFRSGYAGPASAGPARVTKTKTIIMSKVTLEGSARMGSGPGGIRSRPGAVRCGPLSITSVLTREVFTATCKLPVLRFGRIYVYRSSYLLVPLPRTRNLVPHKLLSEPYEYSGKPLVEKLVVNLPASTKSHS